MRRKELRIILGGNIRFHRGRRNWSQANLAEKAGLSLVYLGDIERGNKWPYLDTLVKLSEALEVEPFELIKPKDRLPENITSILAKYSEDSILTMEKLLETMKKTASQSLENLKIQYIK
jgi:transcriptional regulator with XRE-family HTH domain